MQRPLSEPAHFQEKSVPIEIDVLETSIAVSSRKTKQTSLLWLCVDNGALRSLSDEKR